MRSAKENGRFTSINNKHQSHVMVLTDGCNFTISATSSNPASRQSFFEGAEVCGKIEIIILTEDKASWECDTCGAMFEDFEDALECEEKHASKIGGIRYGNDRDSSA